MILIAGAALGLGLLPLGSATHLPVFGPNGVSLQGLVIAVHGTASGVTMAAVILLVASWWRSRRPWGPAAVSLFVAGFTAWLFLPMVAAGWIRNSGAFQPFSYSLRILLVHSPEAYAFEAFYHFWPVACLALLLGCSLSGQTKRWWALDRLVGRVAGDVGARSLRPKRARPKWVTAVHAVLRGVLAVVAKGVFVFIEPQPSAKGSLVESSAGRHATASRSRQTAPWKSLASAYAAARVSI